MLQTLKIENVALIDRAVLEFDAKLNVISGETGAGKSIMLDSLGFVFGGRADRTLIRSGESRMRVEAIFSMLNPVHAEFIKNGADIVGSRTKVKVVKNKVAPPFKTAEFDIMYGEGISILGCLIDCAIELGVIEKSGSWFSYNGDKIGQGKENVKAYLASHPEVADEINEIVRTKLNNK